MRKGIVRLIVSLFYSFLGLSLLILISCGDPSGDPTATLTLTATSTEVAPGGTVEITATVIKAVGQKTEATEAVEAIETTEAATTGPAFEENVTFTLQTPANGGQLDPPTRKTDINGVATTRYKAGNNYSTDVIVATLDNGTSRSIEIKKTATTIAVAASPASVSAGQASVVTATLTGGNNVGVTVTFTMPVNNSGGHLSASSAVTDGAGTAQVTYQAGSNNPTLSVSDTVQAAFGSSSGTVAITRTGTTTTPVTYTFTVTANPSTLTARTGVSVITANVKDNTGTAVVGASVAFAVTSAAGVGTATVTSPVPTDGNGNAGANYSSAHTSATSDIVTATTIIGGVTYTGSTIITVP